MKYKHPFTMVEILLALGVCAIGICSIMVLFPIGANASRDAAMETYAANAADQMLHFMKYRIKANNGSEWGTIISNAGNAGDITNDLPADEDFDLATLNDKSTWKSDVSWGSELQGSIYQQDGEPQVFQIMSHRNPIDKKLGDAEFDISKIDFRAILHIWKEQISVNGEDIPYTIGVKLNAKVAWPAELPATSRQEAYYSLEVFKP